MAVSSGRLCTAACLLLGLMATPGLFAVSSAAAVDLSAQGSAELSAAGAPVEAPSLEQALLWHQQLEARADAAQAAAAGDAPATASPMTTKQERLMLERHNLYRAAHGAPPLTWSRQLAAEASAWATQCRFEHDPWAAAGDNLFVNSLADYSQLDRQALLAVDLWYAEEASYNYDSPGFSKATGHFTQLVWQESTQLGCSMHLCFEGIRADPLITSQQGTLVVCRYSLAGNSGRYAQNVRPRSYVPQPIDIVTAIRPPYANDKLRDTPNYYPLATQRLLAAGATATGCRYSANNRYKLCLLEDSRLVLYKLTTAVWVSSSDSRANGRPFQLQLQQDGSLKVKSPRTGEVIWLADKQQGGGQGRYQLMLSNAGVLTVENKSNSKVVWRVEA